MSAAPAPSPSAASRAAAPAPAVETDARTLFTCGYEGLTIAAFVERLGAAGVRLVVDVRERPQSRKKGFSKNGFREALAAAGIGYEHRPALGCPKPIRDRYKTDRDWDRYTESFLAYLATRQAEIEDLARVTRARPSCLVCFEADPGFCHRRYVARAARAVGAPPVRHLTGEGAVADQ